MNTKTEKRHTPAPVLAQRLERLLRQFTVWNEECEFIMRAVKSHEKLLSLAKEGAEHRRERFGGDSKAYRLAEAVITKSQETV